MSLLDLVHSSKIEHIKETQCLPYWIFVDAVLKSVATNYCLFCCWKGSLVLLNIINCRMKLKRYNSMRELIRRTDMQELQKQVQDMQGRCGSR
jgi:hypothetical protein